MNNPLHHRQNLAHQTIREDKVNRNLSPFFASIQAQRGQTPQPDVKHPADEAIDKEGSPLPTKEPQHTAPTPTRIHHATADHSSHGESAKQTTPQADSLRSPGSNSSRVTPWIIASITLTLALFSGNYAWHTQQDLEKLKSRLEQIEESTVASPVVVLDDSSNRLAKTRQELLSLTQTQEQLTTTVTTLQNSFQTDTEQADSRLTELEDSIADLHLQIQKVALKQKDNRLAIEHVTKLATVNNAKTTHATDNQAKEDWYITIASFSDRNTASNLHQKVQKTAASASITPITVNGKTLYRIRADGYNSRKAAEGEAQTLQNQFGLSGLWVSRD